MPKNMTRDEIRQAEALMERLFPVAPTRDDMAAAFVPVSFNLFGHGPSVVMRLVNRGGETLDVRLSQAVAVTLVGLLARSLHALDMMDSAGHIVPDPSPPDD